MQLSNNSARMVLLYNEISTLPRNKHFFLITPRDLHYYWASAQHCTSLHSMFLPLWLLDKIGVFTLRVAHMVQSLYNSIKGIFILMVPKDLNAFLTFLLAAKTVN